MIANSEVNENGIFFSHPPLVGPAGFLKNQLHQTPPPPPPLQPYHFLEILLSLQKRGRG